MKPPRRWGGSVRLRVLPAVCSWVRTDPSSVCFSKCSSSMQEFSSYAVSGRGVGFSRTFFPPRTGVRTTGPDLPRPNILDFLVGEAVVKRRGFLLVPNLAAVNSIAERDGGGCRWQHCLRCKLQSLRFTICNPDPRPIPAPQRFSG